MEGIVFFDYDGTLADKDEGIPSPTPATLRALSLLRRRGYLPVLCTGRSYCYLPTGAAQWFDTIITANGACGWRNGRRLWRQTLCVPQLLALQRTLAACGAASFYETDDAGYSADLDDPLLCEVMRAMAFSTERFQPLRPSDVAALPVCKCVAFFSDAKKLDAARAALGGDYELRAGKGGRYADINAKGMNKGVGAARLAALLDVPKEKTYAFGDGENDCELLLAAGAGVAMGRHAQELEKAAVFITGTVAQEGVAQGLTRLGLIPALSDAGKID
ncbi:MAG: HAD family hydrolase [Oscillospiraceae bacterium]|nr:HAD family hydrolase [Oscillospiraceae bacterium]